MSDLILISGVTASWLGVGYLLGRAKGYTLGRAKGYKAGRDAQWCDDMFERIKTERDRRNKSGQFKRRA